MFQVVFVMSVPRNVSKLHISFASRVFISKYINLDILILNNIDYIVVTPALPNTYAWRNSSMELVVERSTINTLPVKTVGLFVKDVKVVIMNLEKSVVRVYVFQSHIINLHSYSVVFCNYFLTDVVIDNVNYFHIENGVLRFDNVGILKSNSDLFILGRSVLVIKDFDLESDNYKVTIGPHVALINRNVITTTTEDNRLEQLRNDGVVEKNVIFVVATIIIILLIIVMFILLCRLMVHTTEYQSVNIDPSVKDDENPPTYNSIYPQHQPRGGRGVSKWSFMHCVVCIIMLSGNVDAISLINGNGTHLVNITTGSVNLLNERFDTSPPKPNINITANHHEGKYNGIWVSNEEMLMTILKLDIII
ncbi:hypothetical protein PmNV_112 [Penaeus monodon nudivirus]|uniref:Uncharacterized protein n=1 Tax=Penaeus monodon nudivirus TaxID=1529056 RepID=A0A076FE40_9VIRU|nr:hypothetical protein PmNV_112 [Penaeus monodon nudivirus]AII15900.1 hypothetical protein PmNV_112 [Penaeus monodon nudivirus]